MKYPCCTPQLFSPVESKPYIYVGFEGSFLPLRALLPGPDGKKSKMKEIHG
jgi:hypothetical protein